MRSHGSDIDTARTRHPLYSTVNAIRHRVSGSDAVSGFRLIAIPPCKYDTGDETDSPQPVEAIAQELARNEKPCDDQYSERGVQNRSLVHSQCSGFRSKNGAVPGSPVGSER